VLEERLRGFYIPQDFFEKFVVRLINLIQGYPSNKQSHQYYTVKAGFPKRKCVSAFFLKSVSRRREKKGRLRRDGAPGNAEL
jgi:hypothetical protein